MQKYNLIIFYDNGKPHEIEVTEDELTKFIKCVTSNKSDTWEFNNLVIFASKVKCIEWWKLDRD